MRFRLTSILIQKRNMKEKEDIMNKTITLSRQQLYNEIWQMSVAGVARKYNLNYQKLIAKCKESDIPFPPSGYWTRKNMGKDVTGEVIALPESDIENLDLLLADTKITPKKTKVQSKSIVKTPEPIEHNLNTSTPDPEQVDPTKEISVPIAEITEEYSYEDSILSFLDNEKRNRVIKVASELSIRDKKKLHKCLVKYKNLMSEWKRKEKESQTHGGRLNPRYKSNNEPAFFNEISAESQQRAFLILDAIFYAVEELGGTINEDLSIHIMSDTVTIQIAESQDKVNHELTKQEARALVEYNDRVKHYKWASKPQIRKYDYVYNGKLRISFGTGSYIRDNAKEKLEDRLGDILLHLYKKSNEIRIQREYWEEKERKREEEARKKEELRRKKEDEIKKIRELVNQAEDYKIACEIRQYIAAVIQQKGITPETSDWIEWAKKKADWYDPIVAAEDECLGKREHSKSKEEKDLNKTIINRYGDWSW